MLESGYSERDFGHSEWLKNSSPRREIFRGSAVAVFLLSICVLATVARAQSAESAVQAYADAIKQPVIAQRIGAMERYLTLSSSGSLKVDALEFLVWDHMRLGHQAQSVQRAQELLAIYPGNPIAVAVLNQNSVPVHGKQAAQKRLQMLKSTMSALDRLNKPEGMVDRNFQMLRRQVAIMLDGAIGLSYLDLEDYPDARLSLQQAVDNDPNNPQLVYGLSLALLSGKNRDEYRGYWYLARATNLTGQTPQGQEIANYARHKYHSGGGKDADWQRFLASAAELDAPPSPAGASQPTTATAASGRSTALAAANAPPSARGQSGAPDAKTMAQTRGSKTKTRFGFEDTLREPARIDASPTHPPNRPKGLAAPSQAVSLGILIETSLLTSHNRAAIISTLKDIVRNLRSNDEACILVFSDQLDFEQDLTADDKLLEDALTEIRPRTGRALLSGISFAAGHLKRIGKNNNRILLVISDGYTRQADSDTLQFRSQVTGVRIDCIGLKTPGSTERSLLERIAAYSGGNASFASGPEEFRTAALQMTRSMGIIVE
jgi:tetratricopeptide (TPR) repeat protein